MRSRLFSAAQTHPHYERNRRPSYRENLFGNGDGGLNVAATLRFFYEVDLAEVGNRAMHPFLRSIKEAVDKEMAEARAMGLDPDIQDVINDVCDLSGCLHAVDSCIAGKPVDMGEVIEASIARRAAS